MEMKIISRILIIAVLLGLFAGCTDECKQKESEEKNMALVRQLHAELVKGNVDIFRQSLVTDYVRHCQAMPPGLQEIEGQEKFIAFLEEFLISTPEYSDTISVIFADGDMVAYISTMTGVQSGPMGDLPASGKEFTLTNIVIHRFENGKIAETWVSWDNVAMLTQLGFFPPPSAVEKP